MSEAYAELGAVAAAPPPALDPDRALFLCLVMQGLKRAVTNRPGDRAFLREVCPLHPAKLSEAQREHVMRLAWRYRFSLRPWLRPGKDPDAANPERTEH
jgi:hypothetical protein